jgi:altronate hydrolase/altronate dehydratase small subunit
MGFFNMPACAFQVNPSDTVATMLAATSGGSVQILGIPAQIFATVPIELGHKIAVVAMEEGEPVIKYGITIGIATRSIAPGQWVHLHNCRSQVDERSNSFDLHSGQASDIPYE